MSIDKEKYKSLVKSITNGKDIIPGIHNYCDRWCERCTHTSHCSVFKIEQEMNYTNEEMDIQNEKFWESLSMIYKATFEMLNEKIKEMGLVIEKDDEEKDDEEKDDEEKERDNFVTDPLENDIVIATKDYATNVTKWLDKNRTAILESFEVLKNINEEKALLMADSVDVIQHYFMPIATKTYRASLVYEDCDDNFDSLGSAKIATILVERSIQAWSSLLGFFPNFEDDFLQFLKSLSMIKKMLIIKFPNAMEFKRPGFDD